MFKKQLNHKLAGLLASCRFSPSSQCVRESFARLQHHPPLPRYTSYPHARPGVFLGTLPPALAYPLLPSSLLSSPRRGGDRHGAWRAAARSTPRGVPRPGSRAASRASGGAPALHCTFLHLVAALALSWDLDGEFQG